VDVFLKIYRQQIELEEKERRYINLFNQAMTLFCFMIKRGK
jgi:hypothetical protein